MRWYAIEAYPRRADNALREIQTPTSRRRAFVAFLPKVAVRKRVTVRGVRQSRYEIIRVPLLFNFLFVRFDVNNDCWATIRYIPGVKRILTTSSGRPVPVEAGFVERLIETAKAREIVPDTRLPKLAPGVLVRVVSRDLERPHAFDGCVVRVVRCDGISTTAMVNFLGGEREASFRRCDLTDE